MGQSTEEGLVVPSELAEHQYTQECCGRKRKLSQEVEDGQGPHEEQLLYEGVVSLVGALACHNNPGAQEFSLLALVVLASQGGCQVKTLIANAGAFPLLLQILQSSSSYAAKESAAVAIAKLVSQHDETRAAALEAGVLNSLVNVTKFSGASGVMKARIQAATLVAVLSFCDASFDGETPSVTDAFARLAALLESEVILEVAAGAGGLQALSSSFGKRAIQGFPLELVLSLVHMSKCIYQEARLAAMEELADLRDASCEPEMSSLRSHGVQFLLPFLEKCRGSAAMEEIASAVVSSSIGSDVLHGFFDERIVVPQLMRLVTRGCSLTTRTFAMAGVAKLAARQKKLEALTQADVSLILNALTIDEPPHGNATHITTYFHEHAAATLVYSALSSDHNFDQVISAEAISVLVKLLQSCYVTSEYALMTLIVLADKSHVAAERIALTGGAKLLLGILERPGRGSKFGATWNEMAAAALLTMAANSDDAKKQIVQEDGVFAVLQALRGECSIEKLSHNGVAAMTQLLGMLT